MNLVEGLSREIARCTELLQAYKEIGPAGAFAHTMISQEIERAQKAMGSGDIVEMMAALKALEGCSMTLQLDRPLVELAPGTEGGSMKRIKRTVVIVLTVTFAVLWAANAAQAYDIFWWLKR